MSGTTGAAKVSRDMSNPAAEQISLAKSILSDRGKPLSWEEFSFEYSKFKPGCSTQTLRDIFCGTSVAGLFSSRDFISLDTPKCIGLLRLQLIVEIHDRFKDRKFSKICHKFLVTSTDEEKDCYGHSSELLMKSMHALPDVFCFSSSNDEVHLHSDYTPKQNSFFMYEGDEKLSAIHKLKYFLYLSHGSSSGSAFFEFSRCLLTKEEKKHYSGNICGEVMELIKSLSDFQVVGSTVKLVPLSKPKQQVQTVKEVCFEPSGLTSTANKTNSPALQQDDVLLLRKILQDGPLSWSDFADEYAKHMPGKSIQALQEAIYQSSPSGFLYSPDFISLHRAWSVALLKLQLIVVVDNKLTNGQLGKISYYFNVTASDKEREHFGRNSQQLSESLQKLSQLFSISDTCHTHTQDLRVVHPSSRTLLFQSFFSLEGDNKASLIHKLQYFINLCGGKSSAFSLFEFAKNLLKGTEKTFHKNEKYSFVQMISTMSNHFQVIEDDIKLHKASLWRYNLKKMTQTAKLQDQKESDEERKATAADKAKEVEDILSKQDYAISWKHLENLCFTKSNSKEWVTEFRLHYLPVLDSDCFLFSKEFISLNSSFNRAFLKLCLLLCFDINKKGHCDLQPLNQQFLSITSGVERREFGGDIQSHLSQYPLVFKLDIKSSGTCHVSPGEDMVSFKDFFTCEEHGKEDCLHCQFRFFMKICGGRCHYQKAHNFVQILMSNEQEVGKNDKTMCTQEVDDFIRKCGVVKDGENSDMYVILKPAVSTSSDQAYNASQVSSAPEKNHQPLKHSSEGNSQLPSSSTTKVNLQPAASRRNSHPSSITKEAENAPLKPTEVTPVSSGNNSSSRISRLVKVKIVRNDKILNQVIDHMLNFERPIISMAYREDALVILNWEGNGFLIPFKKADLASTSDGDFAQKWSLLGKFFQNPKVTQVTFDCDAIGRFLLGNFNLQLNDTVFDVKIGAEILPSDCNPTSVTNVADLCQHLNLPSLDTVDVQIVGDLIPKQGEEMVCLEKAIVEEAVREASALIPGIYGKMFQFLEKMDILKVLHGLTGDKLQSLYNMNMDSLLDSHYPFDITDTEPMKQSSSPSSISTGSSIPVSSLNFSGGTSSQVSSQVDPPAKPLPSGFSEIKGSADDWFSTDIGDLPTIPTGIEEIFSQNQFSMIPSLPGTPQFSKQRKELFPQESPVSQYLPQETLLNQLPDFEQSMLQDHPFSLCKDEAGSIIQVPVEEAGSYDLNLSGVTEELVNLFANKHKESMRQLLLLLGIGIFETLRDHFKGDFCDSFNLLTDIVLDLGRNAEARLFRHTKDEIPETMVASSREVTAKDLAEIEKTDVLTGFGDDNRCGIEGALHSLRQVRNKKKKMVGLTVRVHKPLLGCANMMYDIALAGKSTLIMGYSGVGKTTLLRELARCLNDSARKRVIVIDTYNEIAGDYDVPHFSIGGARRLQVYSQENQYQTLLESAKNHSPEILIVDEIESQSDAAAIVKLCQQGIQVIAGVDGESISNLFNDKNLYHLFRNGGDSRLDDSVSLDSAGALAKSKARPTFEALVEMVGCNRWYLHNLALTYNCCLSGQPYPVQERTRIEFQQGLVGEQQIVLQEKVIV